MKKVISRSCLALVIGVGLVQSSFAGAPDWLKRAAALPVPAFAKESAAVVLLDELHEKVSENGRIRKVQRYAVRILTREGRNEAMVEQPYTAESEKIRSLEAWLVQGDGSTKSYGKNETFDRDSLGVDLYAEVRIQSISAVDDAEVGDVFGFESTTEDRSVFTQSIWYFQERWPVLRSSYVLELPKDWKAQSVTFNHAPLTSQQTGNVSRWELKDLPELEIEPASPSHSSLAPWLAVSWFPPSGKNAQSPSFSSWQEVSRWLSKLHDPQAIPEATLIAKAKQLTAGAKSDKEKLEAIARFAQNIRYISVQMGLGKGGGYTPHPASQVLAKAYGDCKDKANLMRALLKAVNIAAFPLAIYSGDPLHVRENWPSPHQFNHCILAVKLEGEAKLGSVVQHPSLGQLVIFDPTDEHTPLGDLPDHEQGSWALLLAGEEGNLLRMPVTVPEKNKQERKIEGILAPNGTLSGSLRESSDGDSAVQERRWFRGLPTPDYEKRVEGWLSSGMAGTQVSLVESQDQFESNDFTLNVSFSIPRFAQVMNGNLLLFKPGFIPQRELPILETKQRQHPVVLTAQASAESLRIRLPAGFAVDEVPDPIQLRTQFGDFEARCQAEEQYLLCTRQLHLPANLVPSEKAEELRGFLEAVRASGEAPVVLIKR